MPFRVIPSAAIPKLRQTGKLRIIWNASVPGPQLVNSDLDSSKGQLLPVAAKAAEALPPYKAMDWISIEQVCVSIHILAGVALSSRCSIQGRSRYLAHWFTMFLVAYPEQWKACVFFGNQFCVYIRAQMGRAASSYIGQRESFLITATDMRHAAQASHQKLYMGMCPNQSLTGPEIGILKMN